MFGFLATLSHTHIRTSRITRFNDSHRKKGIKTTQKTGLNNLNLAAEIESVFFSFKFLIYTVK